jgi:hypothetical protein
LADGSEATVASPDSELPRGQSSRGDSATARGRQRTLRSRAEHAAAILGDPGSIEVDVVGCLRRRALQKARVAVAHGKVRVRGVAGVAYCGPAKRVGSNKARRSQPSQPRATAISGGSPREHAAKRGAAKRTQRRQGDRHIEWRSLHQSRDNEAAYHLLEHGAAVDDSVSTDGGG